MRKKRSRDTGQWFNSERTKYNEQSLMVLRKKFDVAEEIYRFILQSPVRKTNRDRQIRRNKDCQNMGFNLFLIDPFLLWNQKKNILDFGCDVLPRFKDLCETGETKANGKTINYDFKENKLYSQDL